VSQPRTGDEFASEPAVSRFSSIARVRKRCSGVLTACGLAPVAGCHGLLLHLLLLLLLVLQLMRCVACMPALLVLYAAQLGNYKQNRGLQLSEEPQMTTGMRTLIQRCVID
jgi:hypothetical protein